mmetsp:Transcript_1932/g.4973  ORF Transcript_1932/g.4973 Transcript_1932/m.4973 type:complete len:241 (-) Transcript_1932:238-960(-)
MAKKASSFQIKLGGGWQDYEHQEDKIIKRAFLAGFPNARYSLRGNAYEVDFKNMLQVNKNTGKRREIRPPYRWTAPSTPITAPGPTTCVTVPPGGPGTTIQVPHPSAPGHFIQVAVPATARVGQAMLVPVPEIGPDAPPPLAPAAAPAAAPVPAAEKKSEWSTGAKVAAGVGGVAAVGGLAVAGAVLGEHIAEEGWDATMADLGDAAGGVGDAIGDGAEAAADWAGGAAETAGDFIMDLF